MCQQPEDNQNQHNPLDNPAITTAITNLCYIINRLAENSNVCKTIAVAVAGVFVSFTKCPSEGQFWFLFILICILAFNDGIYMGLKKSLENMSDKLATAAQNNTLETTNPFILRNIRKLKWIEIIKDHEKLTTSQKDKDLDWKEDTGKKKQSKITKEILLAWKGFGTITTWPFYLVILGGMLIYKYGEPILNILKN